MRTQKGGRPGTSRGKGASGKRERGLKRELEKSEKDQQT